MTISAFVTVEYSDSDPTDPAPTWPHDITSLVQSVDITGGSSGVFSLYGPRTATIVCLNGKGRVGDPGYVAPFFGIDGFYKWRQIRVLHAGGAAIFTGYIEVVTHDQSNAPFSGTVTITCTDLMGMLARAEFKPTDTFGSTVNGLTFTVSMTVAVNFALSLCGLSQTPTIDAGSTAFFKLPDLPSGQVLAWLQGVLEAEAGGIQVAADGTVVVTGRWEPFAVALAAASVTFSDTATGSERQYLRQNLTFASADVDYYNRGVAKSSFFDATFTVENVPSGYPKESLSRTDLPFVYESWAEANAHLYVKLYGEPRAYPLTLSVYVASAHSASAVIGDIVTITGTFGVTHVVVKQTPAGDDQRTYNVTVENAHHSITPELWQCDLGFASLDRWINAYGDGANIYELVAIGGDSAHGIGSAAIIAP